ncbi:MAG TPA: DNA-formamidopyrimidine glycosylase family protein [Acidobacteriaceae bacterium]|nr:DNA-formamidopyrimidine glycosylase family protein [Acidobacteriaceae bacterium]
MPEGDTIFRSARALQQALGGKTITHFETGYAHLARVDDNKTIAGRVVERVEARGKWLLMFFSGDLILLTHMLMNGTWHIYRAGERWRRRRQDMRIVVETADWIAVAFTVPVAEFHTAASLVHRKMVTELGPDLLKEDFDEADAMQRILEHPTEEIAVVLLNQRVLAGIGNVFKSEICFACGVHPFRLVRTLRRQEVENIVHTSRKYLQANVADGAEGNIVTYTGMRRTTGSSDRSARLWVYGRMGEPCRRCGAALHMRKQGEQARTTFWCPSCQPMRVDAENAQTHGSGSAIEAWSQSSHRKRPVC